MDHTTQRRLQVAAVLAGNVGLLGWLSYARPSTPWLGYWWAATVAVVWSACWVRWTRQRRAAWLDKQVAYWCWHWFTGTPLVLVNHPQLPWWRDLAACWPFLDTDRAEPCPPAEVPDVADLTAVERRQLAVQRRQARREQWRCWLRRAATGLGRTAATGGVVVAEYVRSGAPLGTHPAVLIGWGLAGCVVLVVAAVAVAEVTVQLAMRKWWVLPLALALAQYTRQPEGRRPGSWVKITRAWQWGRRGLRIVLAPTFKAGDKLTLEQTLAQAYAKSGLSPSDVDPVWDTEGHHRSLRLVPARVIPDVVTFSDEVPRSWALERSTRVAPVVGAGKGWAPFQVSLSHDAPHICIAGPTKSGKSEAAHTLLAELLWANRHTPGVHADIWDMKVNSHIPFERLRVVDYYRRPQDIAHRMLAIAEVARQRGVEVARAELENRKLRLPPLYVLFEDTAQAIRVLWSQRSRQLVEGGPTYGDAVDAWDRILGLGRAVNVHVLACPHRPTVRALGGDIARDNFGLVFLMTGHSAGALRLVDPHLRYEPLPNVPGRALVLHGGEHSHVQVLWDQHRQLVGMLADHFGQRDLSLDHDEQILADMEADLAGRPPGGPVAVPPPPTAPQLPDVDHGPDVVTLEDAWQRGLIGRDLQLDSVKRQRTRTRSAIGQYEDVDQAEAAGWWFPPVVRTTPAPGGKELEWYEAAGLTRWWNSRQRQSPDDGEWWVYWLVEGGRAGLRRGVAVKIGFTDDLRQRLRSFGKNWPGADRVGGDIVHLERYPSRSAAMAREKQLHDVYKAAPRDDDAAPTLQVHPQGARRTQGAGGRETFWVEGVLATDMARICPAQRAALQRQVTA